MGSDLHHARTARELDIIPIGVIIEVFLYVDFFVLVRDERHEPVTVAQLKAAIDVFAVKRTGLADFVLGVAKRKHLESDIMAVLPNGSIRLTTQTKRDGTEILGRRLITFATICHQAEMLTSERGVVTGRHSSFLKKGFGLEIVTCV